MSSWMAFMSNRSSNQRYTLSLLWELQSRPLLGQNRGQKGSKSTPKCEKSNARLQKNGSQSGSKMGSKMGSKTGPKTGPKSGQKLVRYIYKYYTVVKDFLKEVFGNIGLISYASSNFIQFRKCPPCERSEPLFPNNLSLNFRLLPQ
jgi:hypothetical protein